jgi:hypothetical protein
MHLADGCKVGISEEAALLLRLPHRFHSVLPLGSPVVVLDLLGGANLHLPVQQSYKKINTVRTSAYASTLNTGGCLWGLRYKLLNHAIFPTSV